MQINFANQGYRDLYQCLNWNVCPCFATYFALDVTWQLRHLSIVVVYVADISFLIQKRTRAHESKLGPLSATDFVP